MKRFRLYALTALLAFSVDVLVSLIRRFQSNTSKAVDITAASLEFPCAPDTFTVKQQPEAAMQLRIVEANCDGSSWNARLTLQNVGTKAVRGYEVSYSEDYQYKKGVRSSQAEIQNAGVLLAPEAIKNLTFGAGFHNGLSCGKPTGSIQMNEFWIKRVEYTDGTTWLTEEK